MENMNTSDLTRLIGMQIYRERIAKKLSQDALAEASKVSRVFISQLENGNATAKLDTYYRIACALGISLCELFRTSKDDGALDGIQLLLGNSSTDEIIAYTEILRVVKFQVSTLLK